MWRLQRTSVPNSIAPLNIEHYLLDVGKVINHYNNVSGGWERFKNWRSGIYFYLDPLRRYIDTGRASAEFLHKLVNAKPYMIARKLMAENGGSYDDAMARVKAYLAIDEN